MSNDEKQKLEGSTTKASADEKEKMEKILKKAEDMFLQHGYSKVTMEEIASGLAMSKKTLYRFFANKKEVLRTLMTERQCEILERIDEIWKDKNLDFIGKYRVMVDFISERSSRINKFQDLQRSEPELWREMHEFKQGKIFEKARSLFKAGFEAGIFRSDIDEDIVIMVYMSAVESIVNPEALSELPCTGGQAFEAISKIVFEGILTEEGRRRYVSYEPNGKHSNEKTVVES
ncbi:MAG: TetR/AcrR family transcriptional regulator [Candidatus Kryptoniota bacterium]